MSLRSVGSGANGVPSSPLTVVIPMTSSGSSFVQYQNIIKSASYSFLTLIMGSGVPPVFSISYKNAIISSFYITVDYKPDSHLELVPATTVASVRTCPKGEFLPTEEELLRHYQEAQRTPVSPIKVYDRHTRWKRFSLTVRFMRTRQYPDIRCLRDLCK